MSVNTKVLNYSLWISLITMLIFPGSPEGVKGIKYGFPISFITYYHQDRWLIRGVNLNILNYFINTLIIYALLLIIIKLYSKFSKRNVRQDKDGGL